MIARTARIGTAGLLSLALFTLGMVAALASVDRGARGAGCLAMVAGLAGLVTVGLLWGSAPSRLGTARSASLLVRTGRRAVSTSGRTSLRASGSAGSSRAR